MLRHQPSVEAILRADSQTCKLLLKFMEQKTSWQQLFKEKFTCIAYYEIQFWLQASSITTSVMKTLKAFVVNTFYILQARSTIRSLDRHRWILTSSDQKCRQEHVQSSKPVI